MRHVTKMIGRWGWSRRILAMALLIAMAVGVGAESAQATWILFPDGTNHPELDWKYVETEHFNIYYYPEVENTARRLYAVAEQIYDSVSGYYNYEMDRKINVTILDTEDYANGWAAYNFNWITIWATNLYAVTRGRSNWVDDVFAHELTHIVSLHAAANFRGNLLGLLIGGSRTSRKHNFDAGFGLLWGSERLPTWIVEGSAQYNSTLYGGDIRDAHREMVTRTAYYEDNLLTIDQMSILRDGNSLQGEMVYNQGMSMNMFLGETWGLDTTAKIWHTAGLTNYTSYNSLLEKELGLSKDELYAKWKEYLAVKYQREVGRLLGGNEVAGYKLKLFHQDPPDDQMNVWDKWHEGLANFHVQYSPDGEYISLASSHGPDQNWRAKLYIKKTSPDPTDINSGKIQEIGKLDGESPFSWSPDSKKIVYSKGSDTDYQFYYYYDLWVYDVDSEEDQQITFDLRATQPSWSPLGDKIAFIINEDGQHKLAVMDYPGLSGHHVILDFKDDTQFGFPTWSPDGSQLAFFMYRHGQQDVWICDNDGANLRPLTYDRFDDRDTSWSPDGQHVVFSSDRNGVFNIYQVNVKTGKVTQLTDVISGAFMPHIKSDGSSLTYSYYTSYGYRPYELPTSSWLNRSVDEFQMDVTPAEIQANLTTTVPIPEIKGRDYSVFDGFGSLIPINKNHAGTWVWIPFVSYEDARLQVGAQFVMSDAVDKNNITAYVYVGEEQRYSVFYENYMLPVTTFLSLHRIFPATATDFEVFDFNVNANFDASFYFVGLRWQDWSLSYNYQDIRVEQPNIRTRQFTSRSYELSVNKSTVPGNIDSGINPRGGHALYARVEYGSPNLHEPFTGAPMGGDVADFFGDPAVITLEEARHYPDENYLLTDYGFTKFEVNYRNYIPFPFWDLSDLNDTLPIKGWDWENLNFERWKRARHTLALKARVGYVHSTIPEGFGYGNSFGRVNFYDRFTGGGLFVSGLGVFSDNGAFLGYENYSLSGETVAVFGYDYRFPLIREIDKEVWAFYFDKLYFSFFGNTGNFWSHVSRKKDMFNADKVFDKSGDGKFNPNDDLISDAGIELRLSSYLFMSNWDSFIKVAHGFQDKENDERDIPLRFYIGLGTGFDD